MSQPEEETITIDKEHINEVVYDTSKKCYDFVTSHPTLFYKGLPLLFMLYMVYPLLYQLFYISPWVFTSYKVYEMIPSGTIPISTKYVKDCLINYLKKDRDTDKEE